MPGRPHAPGDAALIMAGGRGLRMARSGATLPKPLTPVAGVSLLERNLRILARHGFGRIAVATAAADAQTCEHVRERLGPVALELGIALTHLTETRPLGNIGAVQLLSPWRSDLMVVFADNLTSLDLRRLMRAHLSSGAALTLAVHEQPFQMPFGQVEVRDGRVTAYDEKPVHAFPVCSAVSAFAPEALALISPGEAIGLSGLVNKAISRGLRVDAFPHGAPWMDVNDLGRVAEAEALAMGDPDAFGQPPAPAPRRAAP